MILSLPNTGTDWIMSCIQNANYYREFFNPICNKKYESHLKPWFGCEMSSSVEGIAKKISAEQYNEILNKTWNLENYNFTKENYSAFKIEHHIKNFNCYILYRKLSKTLPGNRDWNIIENWYCAMFQSLIMNKETIDEDLKELVEFGSENASKFEEQCVIAYFVYYSKLFKYNLPIIEYDKLINGNETAIQDELKNLSGIDVKKIIATRTNKKRKTTLSCQKIIKETFRLIPANIKDLFGDI